MTTSTASTTTCTDVASVTGTTMIDARSAVVLDSTSMCSSSSMSFNSTGYSAESGDHVESRSSSDPTWEVIIDEPVTAGHSWARFSSPMTTTTCTWQQAADQTVPAGTFHDCWTAVCLSTEGQSQQATYCRGVGAVSWHDDYGTGTTDTGQLVATSG